MHTLVVEDHILVQHALVNLLNAQPDITVVGVARSVQEAVTQARQHSPDCILMDFSLPDGTGVEATQAILAEQPGIKIVFLSIYEDDEKIFNAIQQGARGYLTKTITSTRLLEYLRALKLDEYALESHYTKRIADEFAKSRRPKTA